MNKRHSKNEAFKLCIKQQKTRNALKKWNWKVFGHCKVRIKELTNKIEEIQKLEVTEENSKIEASVQDELVEWMLRDEILWRQKSREMWLKEGDKNSKFFHVTTIIHRRRNLIDAVKAENGEWILDKSKISDYFLNNFKNVFHEKEVEFPWDLENLIPLSLSEMDNDECCKLPTPREIKETHFNMTSQKAPGLDGLPVLFYKTY